MKVEQEERTMGRSPLFGESMRGESFSVTSDQKKRARAAARLLGISKAELYRQALDRYLQSLEVEDDRVQE